MRNACQSQQRHNLQNVITSDRASYKEYMHDSICIHISLCARVCVRLSLHDGMLATKAFHHRATSPNPIYMKGWEQAHVRVGIKKIRSRCYPYCLDFSESFVHWLFLWGEILKQIFLIFSWGVGGHSASISQETTWNGESRNKILGLRSPCWALWGEALYFSLTGLSIKVTKN